MTSRIAALAAAALLGLGTAAQAATVYYNGALTVNDPTFHPTAGSTAGSGVQYYDVYPLVVDTTGAYAFEMASPNSAGTPSNALDTLLQLYTGTFNPAAPGAPTSTNDDFTGTLSILPGPYAANGVTTVATGFQTTQPSSRLGGTATSTVNLTAGTQYFLVNTSFRNTNYVTTGTQGQPIGDYYVGITGPGNITVGGAVPEPSSLALLGTAALALVRRRRASR